MAAPTLYIIGHLCHDRLPSGEIKLGGTAAYAALLARKMGAAVTILTSVGPDFSFLSLFEKKGISIHNIPAKQTTVFENIYPDEGERIQYLHARARTISAGDIPADLIAPDLILFCPIADEVGFDLLECFPNALTAATIQGWLRDWDKEGQVFAKIMDWKRLAPLDLLFFSDADVVGFEDRISAICEFVPLVIMTRGRNGVRVFQDARVMDFPTEPMEVKDTTGAGDRFAVGFLLEYFATGAVVGAVGFGQAMAGAFGIK